MSRGTADSKCRRWMGLKKGGYTCVPCSPLKDPWIYNSVGRGEESQQNYLQLSAAGNNTESKRDEVSVLPVLCCNGETNMRRNPRFREGKSPSRFASGHIAGLGVWGRNAWNAYKSAVRKQS